ncbi:MAG: molecular chaperone HtpG [Rhodospirillales bacterium]|nr:molecular chaperone HtpG [Rhodospirillales bacterium]MCW9001513.1 molecular chaperone HtpG [Rhodospirillales bacterium]
MSKEKLSFQAEVGKLLDIVAHSLYSHSEVFLRELVSNASDACDKLRYEALTRPELTADGGADFRIALTVDADKGTLSVSDNGIGMTRDDLISNLGTIARSGTSAFVENLSGDENKDVSLIGQFGVGFYSAFMVARKVEVTTRKAGEDAAWVWTSDGRGEFTIDDGKRETRGTTVTLHLKKEGKEFAEAARLRQIIKKYSDHIAVPIVLIGGADGKGEDETLNSASALWARSKSEITADQYKEFYHHVAHAFDEPWLTLHNSVEGVVAYTNLLYVPTTRPFDIFHPERKQHVKLYVKKVFITDDCEELLPTYLRFVRGIVDAEDLPLNISREMLQHNPVLAKIRAGLVKRILGELKKKADKTPDEYATFWKAFGALMKEGIYEDFQHRDDLLALARFRTADSDALISLADYTSRMKKGQDAIYYMTGDDAGALSRSPHLEGFRAKGVEVLLLTDPVDEFWVPNIGVFEEKPFKSITRGGADLGSIKGDKAEEPDKKKDAAEDGAVDMLIAAIKLALGEDVKDVRRSERLTDSAVCLVADENDMDVHLQKMLKMHGQLEATTPRVLEINPGHKLIGKLSSMAEKDVNDPALADMAHLLFDQARILEGEALPDAAAFAQRMTRALEKGLAS